MASMVKFLRDTSNKRVRFIWTYSGWFNYLSAIVWICLAAFFLVSDARVKWGLAFAICACAILLVVDIVSVAIIDVRRKRKQPGLKD